MALRFVGKDPESGDHGCPAVWVDDFSDLIRSVQKSAVHLEMRDGYGVDNEIDGFTEWKNGHRLDPDDRASWLRPWLDLVQEVTAGEQVRWLPRRNASDLALPGNDFWLFDGKLVQFNVFDGVGRWVHTDQTEDPAVAAHCAAAFEAVWERGIPHEKYAV
ncbi:DUF6879 family protein [Streptomyces sp. NPDC051582]|uniref:DUF6879 family protein n=1 Tax=Streptomyces sp. NPDC051582 TaxID=3155167 RepID=UPI0034488207